MVNIFEANHGEQTTTREGGGSTVFGSKNKICFLALFSHKMAFVVAIVI